MNEQLLYICGILYYNMKFNVIILSSISNQNLTYMKGN